MLSKKDLTPAILLEELKTCSLSLNKVAQKYNVSKPEIQRLASKYSIIFDRKTNTWREEKPAEQERQVEQEVLLEKMDSNSNNYSYNNIDYRFNQLETDINCLKKELKILLEEIQSLKVVNIPKSNLNPAFIFPKTGDNLKEEINKLSFEELTLVRQYTQNEVFLQSAPTSFRLPVYLMSRFKGCANSYNVTNTELIQYAILQLMRNLDCEMSYENLKITES